MFEAAIAILVLILLFGGSLFGMWLQRRLPEHHRRADSIDAVRLVVSMNVTFAALVLGLLVTSVKTDFDDHTDTYRRYGISLIQLDQRLREYGAQAKPIRDELRGFAATVIAVTWSDEPRPAEAATTGLTSPLGGGDETPVLTAMLTHIEGAILRLAPSDAMQQKLASLLQDKLEQLQQQRWSLVERSFSRLSPIFIGIVMLWLLIIFVVFGIVSPPNMLTTFVIALSALLVASSLYLTLDLSTPVGGFIAVSSQPIRDALWHMRQD